jgi:hypothetical protein
MKLFMTQDPHRDCWDSLPWLANERLSAADCGRIQPHLQQCQSCQEELATQRRLRDAIRAEEPLVLAPQASFQKLMQRVEAANLGEPMEEAAAPSAVPITMPITRLPKWFAIAASVQAIAIALLLSLLWVQHQARMAEPRYSTLTSPTTLPSGPVIRVVLREQATVGDLHALLRSLDATIVSGPNTAGVLTLQLADGRRTDAQVEAVAAQLRADERVLFSEPAVAEITDK